MRTGCIGGEVTIEQQGKACRFTGGMYGGCYGTALLDAVIVRGIGEMRLWLLCTEKGGWVYVGACWPSADLKNRLGEQEKSAALASNGRFNQAGHGWQEGGVDFDAPVALLLVVNTEAADLELVVSKRDGGEVLARLKVEEGWHLAVGSGQGGATFEIDRN